MRIRIARCVLAVTFILIYGIIGLLSGKAVTWANNIILYLYEKVLTTLLHRSS